VIATTALAIRVMELKGYAQGAALRLDGIPHIDHTEGEYFLEHAQLNGLLDGGIGDQETAQRTSRAQIPHIHMV